MNCAQARESLGAYVLGALESAEAEQVRAHLASCPACAEEYAQLSPLPALLDLVPVDQVTSPLLYGLDDDDRIWQGLVHRAEEARSERRRRSVFASVGAVAAAGLLAFLGGVALRAGSDTPQANPTPTPTVATAQSATTVSTRDVRTGVHASVSFVAVGWGTKLTVELGGVAPGEKCSLVAVGASGNRETAASWQVPATGYPGVKGTISVPGAVGMQPDKIRQYELVTTSGKKLLEIPARV
jgi:hypothetical protein